MVMEDAGRQERARVLATKCREELLKSQLGRCCREWKEGREATRNMLVQKGKIYLRPTPAWELGRVGQLEWKSEWNSEESRKDDRW